MNCSESPSEPHRIPKLTTSSRPDRRSILNRTEPLRELNRTIDQTAQLIYTSRRVLWPHLSINFPCLCRNKRKPRKDIHQSRPRNRQLMRHTLDSKSIMRPYRFSDELIGRGDKGSEQNRSALIRQRDRITTVDRSIVSRIDTEIFKDDGRNTTWMHNRQRTWPWYRNSRKVRTHFLIFTISCPSRVLVANALHLVTYGIGSILHYYTRIYLCL